MIPGINLNIPKKLRDLGILAIPMDFFPLDPNSEIRGTQTSLLAFRTENIWGPPKYCKKNPNLYGIYITNFSCGPDSFILHFFRDILKGKPYLEIEIDEHSADAGVVTRLEAFLDSLKNSKAAALSPLIKRKVSRIPSGNQSENLYSSHDRSFPGRGRRLSGLRGGGRGPARFRPGNPDLGPETDFRQGMLSLYPDHRGHGQDGPAEGFRSQACRLFYAFRHRALSFRPVPPFSPPGPGRIGFSPGADLCPGPERDLLPGLGYGGGQ